jgi:hypothetical protein
MSNLLWQPLGWRDLGAVLHCEEGAYEGVPLHHGHHGHQVHLSLVGFRTLHCIICYSLYKQSFQSDHTLLFLYLHDVEGLYGDINKYGFCE